MSKTMIYILMYLCVIDSLHVQSSNEMMLIPKDNITDMSPTILTVPNDPRTDQSTINPATFTVPFDVTHRSMMNLTTLSVDPNTDLATMELLKHQNGELQFSIFSTQTSASHSTTVKATQPKSEDKIDFSISSFKDLAAECSSDAKKVCGCSSNCVVLNNCCHDSQFAGTDIPLNRNIECVESISKKLVLESPAFLVTTCPPDWQNDSVRYNCEKPPGEHIFINIPCYSPGTGLSYLNHFCSQCHNVSQCQIWQLTFQSGNPYIEYIYINTITKMMAISGKKSISRRGWQFVASPGLAQSSAHCVHSTTDSCVPQFSTESLKRYCHMYFNPVQVGKIFYRNIHCYSCSTGIHVDDAVAFPYIKRHLAKMSILIDLNRGKMDTTKGAFAIMPAITRIRGYFEKVIVAIQINGTVDPMEVKSAKFGELAAFCSSKIETTVKLNLRSYNSTLMVRRQLKHPNHICYKIMVTITSDIPVGTILEISQKIINVEFDFLFGGYNVSCCFDKNGTKLHTSNPTSMETKFNLSLKNKPLVLMYLAMILSVTYSL